jgi:hypothetical protein
VNTLTGLGLLVRGHPIVAGRQRIEILDSAFANCRITDCYGPLDSGSRSQSASIILHCVPGLSAGQAARPSASYGRKSAFIAHRFPLLNSS